MKYKGKFIFHFMTIKMRFTDLGPHGLKNGNNGQMLMEQLLIPFCQRL